MSSIRERLLKNVNDFIEIRKIAERYNDDRITYEVAKIYYQNKDVIDLYEAITICERAKNFDLPASIIVQTIYDQGMYAENVNWGYAYDTVNRYFSNDFTRKIGYPNDYALSIVRLSDKLHIPPSFAKTLTDMKIKAYEKIHRVPHEVAVLGATYDMTKGEAENTIKAINYLDEHNIRVDSDITIHKVRRYLEVNPQFYRKNINGVLIVATSEKKLEILDKMISKSFEDGDKEYVEQLSKKSQERGLIVTDLKIDERSCYYGWGEMIYIDNAYDKQNVDIQAGLFYHESSHFLDYNGGEHYSVYNPEVNNNFHNLSKSLFDNTFSNVLNNIKINEKAKNKLSDFLYKHNVHTKIKGLKMMFTTERSAANHYINNEELRNKWKEEIDSTKSEYSEEERRMLFQQKLGYEKSKYINLIGAISDIYDAIDKGNLRDWMGLCGHGKKYYNIHGTDVIEFVAEVGQIINSGGEDILSYEFGKDFSKSFKEMYYNMINYEQPSPNHIIIQVDESKEDDLDESLDFKYDNEEYNSLEKELSNDDSKKRQIQEMLNDLPLEITDTINIENDSESLNNYELQNMLSEKSVNQNNDKTI